jgi:hypothetical protein
MSRTLSLSLFLSNPPRSLSALTYSLIAHPITSSPLNPAPTPISCSYAPVTTSRSSPLHDRPFICSLWRSTSAIITYDHATQTPLLLAVSCCSASSPPCTYFPVPPLPSPCSSECNLRYLSNMTTPLILTLFSPSVDLVEKNTPRSRHWTRKRIRGFVPPCVWIHCLTQKRSNGDPPVHCHSPTLVEQLCPPNFATSSGEACHSLSLYLSQNGRS